MKYILHIDCDAFYASCEEIRNPKLKKRPMAVGGLTNKSIITTANYEARKYGIHSAMPDFSDLLTSSIESRLTFLTTIFASSA